MRYGPHHRSCDGERILRPEFGSDFGISRIRPNSGPKELGARRNSIPVCKSAHHGLTQLLRRDADTCCWRWNHQRAPDAEALAARAVTANLFGKGCLVLACLDGRHWLEVQLATLRKRRVSECAVQRGCMISMAHASRVVCACCESTGASPCTELHGSFRHE